MRDICVRLVSPEPCFAPPPPQARSPTARRTRTSSSAATALRSRRSTTPRWPTRPSSGSWRCGVSSDNGASHQDRLLASPRDVDGRNAQRTTRQRRTVWLHPTTLPAGRSTNDASKKDRLALTRDVNGRSFGARLVELTSGDAAPHLRGKAGVDPNAFDFAAAYAGSPLETANLAELAALAAVEASADATAAAAPPPSAAHALRTLLAYRGRAHYSSGAARRRAFVAPRRPRLATRRWLRRWRRWRRVKSRLAIRP